MDTLAICPGSFDPVTYGHLDIIRRAATMFDSVIVLVSYNATKNGGTFLIPERIDFLKRTTNDIPNVSIDSYDGLTAEYAIQKGAVAIVKGLRAVSDFEDEFQQALINKQLAPDVETVFMVASQEYMYLSSSAVRQVCYFGGDISMFMPESIVGDVKKKILAAKTAREEKGAVGSARLDGEKLSL